MDIKLLRQLAEHLYSMEYAGNDEAEKAEIVDLKASLRKVACKSHRAGDCGVVSETGE
jgi:hypothetical protein